MRAVLLRDRCVGQPGLGPHGVGHPVGAPFDDLECRVDEEVLLDIAVHGTGCDSIQATTSSPGSNRQRFCTAWIIFWSCRCPSPKLNPISELQVNSASRIVARSTSGPR